MCGRYSLIAEQSALARRFDFAGGDWTLPPRYNLAPAQQALTVLRNQARETPDGPDNRAVPMRWGLIPSWAKDMAVGSRMINVRAETIAEKAGFRQSLERRRCLVAADGFYEWEKVGRERLPFYISLTSGEPFAMAGIWDSWRTNQGKAILSCAIITTQANPLLAPIHQRMPAILPRELEDAWLDPAVTDKGLLTAMLTAYPAEEMEYRRVSTLVNSPANDGPECLAPAGELLLFGSPSRSLC